MGQAVAAVFTNDFEDKPIDLVHLSKQTMGDGDLETEILALFSSQCEAYVSAFASAGDIEERKQAAHRIKGTARSIGAWQLAQIAELAEGDQQISAATVRAKVNEVSDYIRLLQSQ